MKYTGDNELPEKEPGAGISWGRLQVGSCAGLAEDSSDKSNGLHCLRQDKKGNIKSPDRVAMTACELWADVT